MGVSPYQMRGAQGNANREGSDVGWMPALASLGKADI